MHYLPAETSQLGLKSVITAATHFPLLEAPQYSRCLCHKTERHTKGDSRVEVVDDK